MSTEKLIRVECSGADAVAVENLIPFQGELKTLEDSAYQELRTDILELGFSEPISVWRHEEKNYILNGHQRLKTLQRMISEDGYSCPPIPISLIEATDIKTAKLKVLALASSFGKVNSKGLFDFMVAADLTLADVEGKMRFHELPIESFKVEFFDDNKVEPQTEPDAVPEVGPEPKTKLGDLYQLGPHRLLCGDSTQISDLERLMDGHQADVLFTDPPYGIGYEGGSKKRKAIDNDGRSDGFGQFLIDVFSTARCVLRPGCPIYACSPVGMEAGQFFAAWEQVGWHYQACLVWVKNNASFTRFDYHTRHEFIHYGWMDGGAHTWVGDRKQDTVWEFNRPAKSELHPTMKPVELVVYALSNSAQRDALVLDLFGGSGTTLIACTQSGQRARLMELDPHYCDVIVKRWEEYTGKKAVLLNAETENGDDTPAGIIPDPL